MKRCLQCEGLFEARGWSCPGCGFSPGLVDGFPALAPELAESDIGYDASRFEVLAGLERRHFWFRSRTRLIVWALRKHFPRMGSLLEIGCGTGNVLAEIALEFGSARTTGSEPHVSGLAHASRRAPRAELLQMDARRIPYREEFDVVGAFDVIEHIDEDERVLGEMHAACRAGGGVVITVPQHRWLWSYRDEFAHHRRRYARADLVRKLETVGFGQVWTTSFVTLLLPVMALSRMTQKRREDFDALRELHVGRVTNRALQAVMDAEFRLIGAGLSLPAGGSLLIVARKTEGER